MKSIIQIVLLVIVGQIFCLSVYSNPTRSSCQEAAQVTKNDYMQMIKIMLKNEGTRRSANPKNNKVYIVTGSTKQYRLPKLKNYLLFLKTVDEMESVRQKNKFIEYIDLTNTKIKDDLVTLYLVSASKAGKYPNGKDRFSRGGRIYEFRQKNFSWEVASVLYFAGDH